jgi:hypothetical protein
MAERSERMKRPRIYGDETKCRRAVARYLRDADDLLDQAEGARNRIRAIAERDVTKRLEMVEVAVGGTWRKDLDRWHDRCREGMRRYLQDQFETVLPGIASHLPRDWSKAGVMMVTLDDGVPWLTHARDDLRELQAALGVRRDVATAAPAAVRFEELHASGLVAAKVIEDHAKEMRAPRTPRQLSNAIGAAKELTEATLRAALDQLEEPPKRKDDLPVLMKNWRKAIGERAAPDPRGEASLKRAQTGLANLVTFLAEWRNAYGRGHGRREYPRDLTARHARLAADAAETCVRFIVTTMDDLELLPP